MFLSANIEVFNWIRINWKSPAFSYIFHWFLFFKKNVFSSVAQSCLTLCDPMNRSTPGLPVRHQLLESTQTHVHCVSDAIQLSHPLSSPSPPALNLSQLTQCLILWCRIYHLSNSTVRDLFLPKNDFRLTKIYLHVLYFRICLEPNWHSSYI